MADQDDQDDAQKTEDPSQRKLEEAAKKGDIVQSQELKHWMMLVAGALAFLIAGKQLAQTVSDQSAGLILHAHEIVVDGGSMLRLARDSGGAILVALALPLGILLIGGLAGNLVQSKPVFTLEKIKPKLSKISPIAGFKRLFSMQRLVEFLKTVAKLVISGSAIFIVMWPRRGMLAELISQPMQATTEAIASLSMLVLLAVIVAMAGIAGLDFLFQKQDHTKKMRMTRQEVKDEHKQMEGDPQVKGRLRQIRMERSRRRMMAAVPSADVVITNPTHFAVALRYKHGETRVPVLVAKGIDAVAMRIRAVATEHDIPMVENPPLARALHAGVEIDEEIPPEHYQAVAEIIGYVLRLKRGVRAAMRPGA